MGKLEKLLNYLKNPKPTVREGLMIEVESKAPEPGEENSMFRAINTHSLVHNYLVDSECKVWDKDSDTLKDFVIKETHVEDNKFFVRGFFMEDEENYEHGETPTLPRWFPQEHVYINVYW